MGANAVNLNDVVTIHGELKDVADSFGFLLGPVGLHKLLALFDKIESLESAATTTDWNDRDDRRFFAANISTTLYAVMDAITWVESLADSAPSADDFAIGP
jgi:hypothetical protein